MLNLDLGGARESVLTPSVAFAINETLGSLWVPLRGNISTLQDSLYGTDYWVALPSQEQTTLHHNQSPGSSGSSLRGSLVITTTGLAPASHQHLSKAHQCMLYTRT